MNYAAMRADFIGLLNRTDCIDPNAALVKGWFDKSIARCQREVRAPHMERVLVIDTTADVSEVIVPDDWLETKAMVWETDGESGEVDSLELGTFYQRKKNQTCAYPTYYCRQYDRWLLIASFAAGMTAKVIYYGEETPLVNDTDETTLATIAPDLIVYGALTYAGDYFTDERAPTWEQKWQFFREQVQDQSAEGELETGSNAVQPFAEYDDHV